MTAPPPLRDLALDLPGVVETTSFRLPTFTVAGKGFLSVEKGGTVILAVGEAQAGELAGAEPELFEVVRRNEKVFVGVRIHDVAAVPADRLRGLVEAAWRTKAPKSLQAQQHSG